MGSPRAPVDLSDLDPFSPLSSRTPSPHPNGNLFPTSTCPSTSSATAPARPPTKSTLSARPLSPSAGADPLGSLLANLSLNSASPSPTPSSSSPALPPPPSTAAQQARHDHMLADLSRQPFTAEPSSSPSSPSSSSSRPHVAHPSHPFHPPRRLSTLMSASSSSSDPSSSTSYGTVPTTGAFAPGSPPASSSILSDPFHPSHYAPGGAERRMREASAGSGLAGLPPPVPPSGGGKASSRAGGGGEDDWSTGLHEALNGDSSWGDFQEAPPTPPRRSPAPPSSRSSAPSSSSSSAVPPPKKDKERERPTPKARTYPDPASLSARSGKGGSAFDPAAQPIQLVGVRPGVQRVLDEDVAEGLRPSLPPRLRLSPRWTLLYSLDQHGISLSTFFTSLERGLRDRDGGFVLVVRTERGEVLGAYCSEALKRPGREEGRGAERWVGDGTCFLFLTRPFPPSDPRLGLAVRAFRPTFRNTYFAHASPPLSSGSSSSAAGFLAFGGGNDGVFGLWLDGQFERGWTGRSETYANEVLIQGGLGSGEGEGAGAGEGEGDGRGKFEVVGLECWAVGT
ncbi:hypothetical protein JCM8097_006775 [Rhodosporidiobolus ruineniae]